jgi:hypothetical protein
LSVPTGSSEADCRQGQGQDRLPADAAARIGFLPEDQQQGLMLLVGRAQHLHLISGALVGSEHRGAGGIYTWISPERKVISI